MTWPTVQLGDIFQIARGGSPRPINKYITDDADGLNWVMIGDASASEKIIYRTKKKIRKEGLKKTRSVKPGDFILSNSMSFGRPYIMGTHGCIHDGWLLLRPILNQVHQDFFYHLLGSPNIFQQFAARAAGATVKNLNSEIVREVKIPLPPLEEQRRIAGILDQADALRRTRRQAIARLNQLSQSIFYDMFLTNPHADWLVESIKDLSTSMRTGPFGSQLLHSEFTSSGINVLGIDNAVTNEFKWGEARYISKDKYETLKRYTVYPGDVLITIMGTCGRCAIVPDDVPVAINTKHLCCITLDKTKAIPEFLHAAFLYHPEILRQLGVQSKGAVMPGLNKGIIEKLVLPVPPLGLQSGFANSVKKIRVQITFLEKSLHHLDALFASLQHRAFAGEL